MVSIKANFSEPTFLGLKVKICTEFGVHRYVHDQSQHEELFRGSGLAWGGPYGPKYQHSQIAGEAGYILASGIMMAHSYLSTIMGSGPVQSDMVMRLPHKLLGQFIDCTIR